MRDLSIAILVYSGDVSKILKNMVGKTSHESISLEPNLLEAVEDTYHLNMCFCLAFPLPCQFSAGYQKSFKQHYLESIILSHSHQ